MTKLKEQLTQLVDVAKVLAILAGAGLVCLIGLALAGWFIWWLFNSETIEEWRYGHTWWDGVETMEVCGATDQTEGQCYFLRVASDDGLPSTIYFTNGGYLVARDASCHKAASFYDFDRFCRFWDQDGRKWDIQPHPADTKHRK